MLMPLTYTILFFLLCHALVMTIVYWKCPSTCKLLSPAPVHPPPDTHLLFNAHDFRIAQMDYESSLIIWWTWNYCSKQLMKRTIKRTTTSPGNMPIEPYCCRLCWLVHLVAWSSMGGAVNYFLLHLPSSIDLIPYWDFDAPHNSTIAYQPRDTSVASIFSSALVELSQQVTEPDLCDKFLSSAKAIVDQLITSTYLILGNKDYVLSAIVANGTHSPYPEKAYDVATVVADYYLTQTVWRLVKFASLF